MKQSVGQAARRGVRAWLPVAAYMAVIYILSAQPDTPGPLILDYHDKLLHAAAYIIMGVLSWRAAWTSPALGRVGPYWQAFAISALYGLCDELHQSRVPGRDADPLDWAADVLGACIGLAVIAFLRRRYANGGR